VFVDEQFELLVGREMLHRSIEIEGQSHEEKR
jgi:hypothetical protein